jgi:hypothetical protein
MKYKGHNVYFLSIVAILNCFNFSTNYAQPQNDSLLIFRHNKFGDSPELVKENETASYMQDFRGFNVHVISYADEFADLEVRIDYTFRNGILTEASYNIDNTDDLFGDFIKLRTKLENVFGEPHYFANSRISDSAIWIRQNDYGAYKGPELYWQFANGFIVLHASKFKDEESLTVLYVMNKTIDNYGGEKIQMPNWSPQLKQNIHQ